MFKENFEKTNPQKELFAHNEKIRANILHIIEGYLSLLNKWEDLKYKLQANEVGELELADKIKREQNKEIKEDNKKETDEAGELELADKMEGERYTKAEGKTNLDYDDAREIMDLDFEKLREITDDKLNILAEKINDLMKKGEIKFLESNSFVDILNNITSAKIFVAIQNIKNIEKGKIKEKEDISVTKRKLLNDLNDSLEDIINYLDQICLDDEKLKFELAEKNGYLEKFSEFFSTKTITENGNEKEVANIPTGPKKIPFLMFFIGLENGSINENNLEDSLEKLEAGYLLEDQKKLTKKIKEKFY